MSNDLKLADYTAKHRTRQRGMENGTVVVTGKKEKKWKGYYHVWVDGKRIKRERIIGTCKELTKAKAKEEHREFIRKLHKQPIADTKQATVAQMCEDYYQLKVGDWGTASIRTNRGLIDNVIVPAIGSMALESVKPEDLKLFINSMPQRKWKPKTVYARADGTKATVYAKKAKDGCSASYVRKAIIILRAIFDLAAERELIRKNPARSIIVKLKVPKAVRAPYKPILPPAQLPLLLKQLDRRGSMVVWISMLGATRPNELFALTGGDVGPEWVHVHRALDSRRRFKGTKTDKPRYVFMPPELAGELHEWVRTNQIGPDDFLFQNRKGGAVDSKNFLTRTLRPAAVRAKIAATDVDFRMLRRSFATVAKALKLDIKSTIQAQMGHTTVDVTANEYIQGADDVRRQDLAMMENVLRGRVPMPVDVAAKLGSQMVQ